MICTVVLNTCFLVCYANIVALLSLFVVVLMVVEHMFSRLPDVPVAIVFAAVPVAVFLIVSSSCSRCIDVAEFHS